MAFGKEPPASSMLSFARYRSGLVCLLLIGGCSEPTSTPQVGSNTNWLTACDLGAECSASLSCNCGVCSKTCESDADCSSFSDTVCLPQADTAAKALCGGSVTWASQGICLPRCEPGGCGEQLACALGACVPMALPNSAFCSPVAASVADSQTREDELALAVEQARSTGGLTCGNGTAIGKMPYVRVDPRLTCAARALAQDMAATGSQSLTDSVGRTTTDRLRLAGYQALSWAEGYAWDTTSASAALTLMLADADFCTGFANASLADMGVGYVDNTYVLTLAVE